MNAPTRSADLERLIRLAGRRHERAAAALAAAREALAGFERVLAEQRALVADMRRAIDALAASRPAGGQLSAESLQLEVRRRRWLVSDIEKETFYLDTMEDDVIGATEDVAARRIAWRELGQRLERLETLATEEARGERVRRVRREEARAGERGSRSVALSPGAERCGIGIVGAARERGR